MKAFFISTILVGGIALTACKKDKSTDDDHDDHEEHATALITLTNPHENDTIQGNFSITGSIVGTANLHGYQVTVKKAANDSIIYQNEVHDHLAEFTINQSVTNSFTVYTPLKLEVVVALDHDGNTESKTVNFVVH
ncbi:MAG: hypothetical protein ACO1N0_14085 [Fluviicola sp.]